jgi:predicted phage tail protein
MDLDSSESKDKELRAAVTSAADEVNYLLDVPANRQKFMGSGPGGYEALLGEAKLALQAAKDALLKAKPLKSRLQSAEEWLERVAVRQTAAAEQTASLQKEMQQLQEKMQEHGLVVSKLDADHADAQAKVATLAAESAAEKGAALLVPQPAGPAAAPEGYISIAFAEEKWAEGMVQMQACIAQLQAQLEVRVAADNKSEAPSEAGELELEGLDEDDGWESVGKDKRKKMLGKMQDKLASRMRTGLSTVSAVKSPFRDGKK